MLAGHAFLVRGGSADVDRMPELLRRLGLPTGGPDLYVRRFDTFSIDDAREIVERAALRGMGGRRIFVLAADSIGAEAQNALLKTLEEPRGGALFFFVHPAPETLLATLRSRMQPISLPEESASDPRADTALFLASPPAKRLELLAPILEARGEGRSGKGEALAFLSALERALAASAGSREALGAVYRARRYADDRGALMKQLLEQVALLV